MDQGRPQGAPSQGTHCPSGGRPSRQPGRFHHATPATRALFSAIRRNARARASQGLRRLQDLLEPDAVKVARPVLRGPRRSNASGLPDKHTTGFYPRARVDTAKVSAVGQAGGVLLTQTVRAAGLDVGLSAALARWRRPLAVHDPAKVVLDLALLLALGGDCLADVALLRAEPGVYGLVASDSTVSRTIAALAADAPAALAAIDTARAAARAQVWALAGRHAPDHDASAAQPLIVDIDATL